MSKNFDFDYWCLKNKIPEQTKKYIENIRESPPSRNVQSGPKNVRGNYPSKKMGCTIQFESHTVELAAIYLKEYNNEIKEFYDQPPSIPIKYKKNGQSKGMRYTPDFFVIEDDKAGWEEWKTEEDLIRLEEKNPNRYYKDTNGQWRCPPGEEYAKKYGLFFRVRSSSEIDENLYNNTIFLEDYLRYNIEVDDITVNTIISTVTLEPGIKLDKLIKSLGEEYVDSIYHLIVSNELFVDLKNEMLGSRMFPPPIYPDELTAKAFNYSISKTQEQRPEIIDIKIGNKINWDGRSFTIANIGETTITLISQDDNQQIDLPHNSFEELLQNGKVKLDKIGENTNKDNEKINEILSKASPEAMEIATKRYEEIVPILNGKNPNTDTPPRTLRNWVSNYREAEKVFGNGYVGLLPRHKDKGNKMPQIHQRTRELMEEIIETDYENTKQKNKNSVYQKFRIECEKQGLEPSSYKTFINEINKRPNYEKVKKREGSKASYPYEPPLRLDQNTPKHGNRPFEICHIDHTQMDIELVNSITRENMGKPWVTFMTDAFSRRLLGIYLTFDEPSYRSIMMVVRECVRRFNRLPQNFVIDGGKEFHSIYFDSFLARYECIKKTRPPSKSRFGNVIERLFGTTHSQLIYNLQGNTQATKKVRQITKGTNPKNKAIWTLEELYTVLCEWGYELYDTTPHPALSQTPRDAFNDGMVYSGKRYSRLIRYDDQFKIDTLPSTQKGTAKVQPGRGVKIDKRYFWHDQFKNPEIEYTQVPVRYDPFNMGIAYVFVNKHWVKCISEYYSVFKNRTEKELKRASEELRQKQSPSKSAISAKKLANFLIQIEEKESKLLKQKKERAMENQNVIDKITGNPNVDEVNVTHEPPVFNDDLIDPNENSDTYEEF
ncbi:TnsA endonuclease N-terminal domain-containing protein [Natranaerobius thermophilus]|uniref:TnsA endonuclease n=1 Tax=Natranaerobius thermophilus (strain ATCC BAA-1301 / DSM 18059 / JW/NM-WN-LF) TaxID=457570 RepID=B2A6L9_NATTJ|nr:TnsA endonuclease N-terminal domain-containing protein [Natranaerobius thermophilus]ACB85552.1 TnsA endonuclease [Natranaerobius thermophilus JW/NM-WN-LF]